MAKKKSKPAKSKSSGNKTTRTRASVSAFLRGLDEARQAECQQLVDMMQKITGGKATMWGTSIVGFGSYHYQYASGREGDWLETGFSPRKQNLSIYIMDGLSEHTELLDKLGPHKTGKSCLYIKSLDQVHLPTLKKLIRSSVTRIRELHPKSS